VRRRPKVGCHAGPVMDSDKDYGGGDGPTASLEVQAGHGSGMELTWISRLVCSIRANHLLPNDYMIMDFLEVVPMIGEAGGGQRARNGATLSGEVRRGARQRPEGRRV
jgi:hypothetical protein